MAGPRAGLTPTKEPPTGAQGTWAWERPVRALGRSERQAPLPTGSRSALRRVSPRLLSALRCAAGCPAAPPGVPVSGGTCSPAPWGRAAWTGAPRQGRLEAELEGVLLREPLVQGGPGSPSRWAVQCDFPEGQVTQTLLAKAMGQSQAPGAAPGARPSLLECGEGRAGGWRRPTPLAGVRSARATALGEKLLAVGGKGPYHSPPPGARVSSVYQESPGSWATGGSGSSEGEAGSPQA